MAKVEGEYVKEGKRYGENAEKDVADGQVGDENVPRCHHVLKNYLLNTWGSFFSFFSKIHLSGHCHVAIILVQMVSDASTFNKCNVSVIIHRSLRSTLLSVQPSIWSFDNIDKKSRQLRSSKCNQEYCTSCLSGKPLRRQHFYNNLVPRYSPSSSFIMCHFKYLVMGTPIPQHTLLVRKAASTATFARSPTVRIAP